MATPHVAGIAGLLYSYEPNLTQSDIYTILLNTAVDLGAPGRDNQYGWGLVQAGKALEYLINVGREHGVAPTGGALNPAGGGSPGSVALSALIRDRRPQGRSVSRRGAIRPTSGAERHPTRILLRLEDATGARVRPSRQETARQAQALLDLHPGARIPEAGRGGITGGSSTAAGPSTAIPSDISQAIEAPGVIILEAESSQGWLRLLEDLASDPAVRYAQPVYRYRPIW
jgi:hypothetical protein